MFLIIIIKTKIIRAIAMYNNIQPPTKIKKTMHFLDLRLIYFP